MEPDMRDQLSCIAANVKHQERRLERLEGQIANMQGQLNELRKAMKLGTTLFYEFRQGLGTLKSVNRELLNRIQRQEEDPWQK